MNASIFDTPAVYRVAVWGWLDEKWSARLAGMRITHAGGPDGAPITTLTGELTDQAAVSGLLHGLYNLGFTLLSVERLSGRQLPTDRASIDR
jgi:hypothetical protein